MWPLILHFILYLSAAMGSYKDRLWKEIQHVMFRKQAATGYTIVVSPLLKKFTGRYRKNVLPCLACGEERQGQQG